MYTAALILAVMIMAVIILFGSLHVIAGTSIVDHSTTSRANIASLLQGGAGIGAEASVQARKGVVPFLIGADALEDAAPTVNECKIQLNTWKSTDYIELLPEQLTARFGKIDPRNNVGAPWALDLEADWDIDYESTGVVDQFVALLLSYPPIIPMKGGKIIWRKGAVTSADYSTTAAFGTAVAINDLDPRKIYRIAALLGKGGTDVGILRMKAPSFSGQVIQALIPDGHFGGYIFPFDSLLVTGVETISVDASGGAVSASEYAVAFEEYGTLQNIAQPAEDISFAPANSIAGGGVIGGTLESVMGAGMGALLELMR